MMNKLNNAAEADIVDDISDQSVASDIPAIVVIGTGPVGMSLVEEFTKRKTDVPVVVYGSEPCRPYDRVRLSLYLAGDVLRDDLDIECKGSKDARIDYRYNCPVFRIDRKNKTVFDAAGGIQKYSSLVLAVGSEPYVPAFGNSNYKGVYTFRTMHEADELLARKTRTSNTVIIGGGLLGLETARAMQKYNTHITIVEHNSRLMMQQLDDEGARCLQDFIESSGIDVVLNDSVIAAEGKWRVESVALRSGKQIACDTLIVAAGIRPNMKLALDAGLSCNKGVRINDHLETSDKSIYAIGECAEHNNSVYGLVKPGLEQAAVLADCLAGGDAQYRGSLDSARLKVMNIAVFSSGRTGIYEEARASVNEYVYQSSRDGIYRKLRIFGNRIIGVISVGVWHESALIQEAIQEKRRLWFWQVLRFKVSGNIWGDAEDLNVANWPSTAIVCNCTGVTHAELSRAISSGCNSVACLKSVTRASSVCGSCEPLLAEMLGNEAQVEPTRSRQSLLFMSVISLLIVALFVFIWRIPYADSVQQQIRWDTLWRDSLYKQISGFSVLAMFVIGLALSLRKRVSKISMGDYNLWRMTHVALGIGAMLMLIVHSGFRLGADLNFILMLNVLLLAVVGANASLVVSTEHHMVPAVARKKRKHWNELHLLLFWPIPVLLGFHILKTYYF